MKQKHLIAALGLVAALALALPALADSPRQISVSGEGRVMAVPDMATVQIGVSREAESAADALAAASEAARAMLDELAAAGIEPRDVQTSGLTLNPQWDHRPSRDQGPRITGYMAVNSVTVRVRDLALLGDVLEATVGSGANSFGGLGFGVAAPESLRAQARAAAVGDAMGRARELAGAAGVMLGPVLRIEEPGSGSQPPAPMLRAEMAMDSGVPVAPGEMEITARVNMVFGIGE
ncbi:SIMPL domain-containing protein [Alkalilacustris brevis]|uniref:SIMPL domain-containing protein n=1 Tax=Alkalilacustris brevis TaxID=2026338 RepID=UPI000E0D363C|nr:SIMPL domain-containing protein [Alkalilacustris brevis]